ncbi:MAG: YHYH protein [Ktedonobacterales bacterium]
MNLTALPLGDGHVSSSAQVGYVFSCQTSFSNRGGAYMNGPWITGFAWNATAKISVQGAITWPQANYSVKVVGGQRIITTNDLPVHFTTGIFPISSSDPAFAYDRNPNTIRAQSLTYTLPANPTVAAAPSCVNMGPIGVLADGVALFNALDAGGRDAVAHEVLDSCGGHPDMSSEYHHHDIPPCLLATAKGTSTLVGYAKDGFGIYVERDAQGNLPTNADLDGCHGRVSTILWDGHEVSMFHYVATAEYPYTVGCYMGTSVQ